MTWTCRNCRRTRMGTGTWLCSEGYFCEPCAAPARDPWDAFRPLALPEGGPPVAVEVLAEWDDSGNVVLKSRDISASEFYTSPTIKSRRPNQCRSWVEGMAMTCHPAREARATMSRAKDWVERMRDLAEGYEAEEAAFNLDRGGR